MATRTGQVINQGSAHLGLKELCVFPAHCLETNTRSTFFPFWGHKPCSLSRQADNGPKYMTYIYMMVALVVNPFCIQSLRTHGVSNDWESQETNEKPTEVQKPMIPTYEDGDLTPPNHTKPMYSGSLWWAFLRSTQTCIFAQHLLSEWVLLSDALSYQPQPPRKNNSHVILEVLGKQQAPNITKYHSIHSEKHYCSKIQQRSRTKPKPRSITFFSCSWSLRLSPIWLQKHAKIA